MVIQVILQGPRCLSSIYFLYTLGVEYLGSSMKCILYYLDSPWRHMVRFCVKAVLSAELMSLNEVPFFCDGQQFEATLPGRLFMVSGTYVLRHSKCNQFMVSILDMAADISGLHTALADPFWPADLDLMVSTHEVEGMADMDASDFFVGGGDDRFMLPSSTTSSLSSKRSLSLDSGGSSGSGSFTLDLANASRYQAPALPVPHNPLAGAVDHDDEAIMRAMMAVMSSSSASPSSSASSHPQPFCRDRDSSMQQQSATMAPQLRGGGRSGHVMVKSSLSMSPERSSSGGRGQQQEDPTRAVSSNTGQLYHMMSERKRREKLNDSFHTLRSLLPPCSKKDKTTVLTKAAGYLKTLEAQVSELEEKNNKLEKHILAYDCEEDMPHQQRRQRAKVQITKAASDEVVNLTVMVMVECDVVELVLRILECLRWMEQVSVMSVDADTYSPQVLLKAIASIKLRIVDDDWNQALFHEAMTKAVNDATASPPPLLLTA